MRVACRSDGQPSATGSTRHARRTWRRGAQFRDLCAKAGTDKPDTTGNIRQAQAQWRHKWVTKEDRDLRAQAQGREDQPDALIAERTGYCGAGKLSETLARDGAGDGNRTHVSSLGSYSSTIELRPRCRCSLCAGPGVAQEIGAMRAAVRGRKRHDPAGAVEMQKGFSPDGSNSEASGLKPLPQQALLPLYIPRPTLPGTQPGKAGRNRAVLRSYRRSSRTARCRGRATGRWWWRCRRCSQSPTAWSVRPAPPTRSCGRS